MLRRYAINLLLLLSTIALLHGCDDIFGSKEDDTTDEIFEEGRQDPQAQEDVVGYAALVPFWENFNQPTDVFAGFDELVYVTDADGLTVLDEAGRRFQTIPFDGAVAVTQDRLFNVYVAARIDTVIDVIDPDITWNLATVYKIRNANGAGELAIVDTLIHPFMDDSRSTQATQLSRLEKGSETNDELVEITGLTTLADNTLYVTRRGPLNNRTAITAPDNTVLEFQPLVENGEPTLKMRNVRQIRSINPITPSLLSGIGMSDITSFIGPPQRQSMSDNRSFMIAQASLETEIPFRVLQVIVRETPDGLVFEPNTNLLNTDTTQANGFLMEQFRFGQPSGVAFAGDGSNNLFVVDALKDSLYQFQFNGQEGVTPPPGSSSEKPIIVSFGGTGAGPKQFSEPSGVAFFDEVLYVADKGNNRIARYKLTTDFE